MQVAPGLNIVSASNKDDGAYAYANARVFCIVLSFSSVACRQVPFPVWHFSSVPTCCWRCGSCYVSYSQGDSIRSQCRHVLLSRRLCLFCKLRQSLASVIKSYCRLFLSLRTLRRQQRCANLTQVFCICHFPIGFAMGTYHECHIRQGQL